MYNKEKEVWEAIAAGERALQSLQETRASLESAGGWGFFDILGGGLISSLIKHSKMSDAQDSLNRAKMDLAGFSRELADVQDLQGLDIQVGDFLTFADFFFDGLLADLLVQSKIQQAKDAVDNAIARVEAVLDQLRNC